MMISIIVKKITSKEFIKLNFCSFTIVEGRLMLFELLTLAESLSLK